MNNFNTNELLIKKIAVALGEINERVVFVGGAVVGFYANDPAADDVRPTIDIDISVEITSNIELEEFRKKINKIGFKHDAEIICRFHYEEIIVDVMGRTEIGWAPANKWFDAGFDHLEEIKIDDIKIKILSFPYFLATKFEAYQSRGSSDPRASKDFEDISYLLDNVIDFPEKICSSDRDIKAYLIDLLKEIQSSKILQEGIFSQLSYQTQNERFKIIMKKVDDLVKLES